MSSPLKGRSSALAEISVPHLVAAVPGPKAQAVVARSERAVSPSLPRAYPLAVKRAQGVVVEDVDGNLFLDCAAGIAVCATGHCHPAVVKAPSHRRRLRRC